jgi:hypothetical protein
MNEKIQTTVDDLVKMLLGSIGEPPYNYSTMLKTVSQVEALIFTFKDNLHDVPDITINISGDEEVPATWMPPPPAPTADVATKQKRTRRIKPEITEPEEPAPVEEAPTPEEDVFVADPMNGLKNPFSDTAGSRLMFKFPNLNALTAPQDPQKVVVDHKTAWEIVLQYAKNTQVAQIEKGSAHGKPLAVAAIKRLGGSRIGDVPPAKWGELVDMFEAIAKADLTDAPEMEATDAAGYEKLLKGVLAGRYDTSL